MFIEISLFLFIFSIFIIIYGLFNINICNPKIIYRFIPRNFDQFQNNQLFVSDMFKKMFDDNSPWINNTNDTYNVIKDEYSVSQF